MNKKTNQEGGACVAERPKLTDAPVNQACAAEKTLSPEEISQAKKELARSVQRLFLRLPLDNSALPAKLVP